MSSSPTNLDAVIVPLVRGSTVLDVGCGYGRWASLIHANFWEAGLRGPPQIDGVDGYVPNVEAAKALGLYRKAWHQLLPGPLDGKWDTVLACEILEHLPQEQIVEMLDLLESAAGLRVIISTPNGPAFRGGDDTLHGFNELEAHLSYIPRSVLKRRGYRLHGVGFGAPGTLLEKLMVRTRLGRDLASLSLHVPALGAAYVAYKDMGAD